VYFFFFIEPFQLLTWTAVTAADFVYFRAMNYGSLGMVVGHEITHGFDKQGKYTGWIGKYGAVFLSFINLWAYFLGAERFEFSRLRELATFTK
jgi:hypothetical protein